MSATFSESPKESYIKCPLCSKKLTSINFTKHFQAELSRFEVRQTRSKRYIIKPSAKKPKMSFDLPNLDQVNLTSQKTVLQTLRQLRQNKRQRRLGGSSQRGSDSGPAPNQSNSPPAETATTSTTTALPKCPICLESLDCDDLQMNAHIDECLFHAGENQEESPEEEEGEGEGEGDDDESYEEYTWAGQTRVRTTSLDIYNLGGVEGYLSAKKSQDEDEDLNIDENNESTLFGKSQFDENDVLNFMNEKSTTREDHPSTSSTHSAPESEMSVYNSTQTNGQTRPLSPAPSLPVADTTTKCRVAPKSNHPPHSQLVIDSLKSQLQQLQSQSAHSCLICQESFDVPLTSVNCWHVYCKGCWMRSLAAKKLCPQCQTITYPGDLRKIYL